MIRARRIDTATSVFALSALTQCVYGAADDVRIVYAYDFADDTVKTLFSVEEEY